MRHTIYHHNPDLYTARPVRSTVKSRQWNPVQDDINRMKSNRVICEYERRAEDRAKLKQQQCNNINNNQHNIFEDDTLQAYGNYNQSWSLYSAASGHYCGKSTIINNRKITSLGGGIQVDVANNQLMQQIEEGELQFDRLPSKRSSTTTNNDSLY
jgi:hypothetical protein